MNKSVFLFIITCLLCAIYATASGDQRELSGDESRGLLEKLNTVQKGTSAFAASVRQEKYLRILKQPVIQEGTVLISKPAMFRLEIEKPVKSVTVADGKTMTVYHPGIKEAQVYNLSEDVIAHNTMNFFKTALSGDLSGLEKKFTVNMFRKDNEIIVKLVPLSKITGKYLSGILISYDEVSGLPSGFEATTPKGDRTLTRFTGIRVNPETGPEDFSIKLPDDVVITNKVEWASKE